MQEKNLMSLFSYIIEQLEKYKFININWICDDIIKYILYRCSNF